MVKHFLYRLKAVKKRIVKTYQSSVELIFDIIEVASDIKILISYYRWNLVVMVACALSPVVYQMIQQNPENAANKGMLFSFYERLTVDFTTNNFNSTFIPLAYSEGTGNCLKNFNF